MSARVSKYFIFAKSGVQMQIAYRGSAVLWVLGGVLNATVMGLLWWAIFNYSGETQISGYTFPQMLMYVISSAVVGEVVYSGTANEISDDVHDGLIGMRLMKPVNYRAQLGFRAFGVYIMRMIMFALPIMLAGTLVSVYAFGLTGIKWYNVLLFIPATLVALLMSDTIGFIFGQLAFRTQAMFGVLSIMDVFIGFLSGRMIPIELFPSWAQTVLAYTPFPSMGSFPSRLFMGMMTWSEIGITFGIALAWLLVLNVLCELLYKGSVRHVVVFGG